MTPGHLISNQFAQHIPANASSFSLILPNPPHSFPHLDQLGKMALNLEKQLLFVSPRAVRMIRTIADTDILT
jgi:hypothetical protein